MLTGLIAPWLRLGFVSPSISCEHCRSSRKNPHYAPRYIIYCCVQTDGKSRIACLRVERHAANCASATQSGAMFITPASMGKMFIPSYILLPAANYVLARITTFFTNLDTKRGVYLERHGVDVTRVDTALATLGRVLFALVTIATMPPLVHNLLFWSSPVGLGISSIFIPGAHCNLDYPKLWRRCLFQKEGVRCQYLEALILDYKRGEALEILLSVYLLMKRKSERFF